MHTRRGATARTTHSHKMANHNDMTSDKTTSEVTMKRSKFDS